MLHNHFRLPITLAIVLLLRNVDPLAAQPAPTPRPVHETPLLRRPVALEFTNQGKTLLVANHRSGSVSAIDVPTGRVTREVVVAQRLADFTTAANGKLLLAVDEQADQLIVLDADTLQSRARLDVSATPVTVALAPDGRQCSIASLWSRRLTLVDVSRPQAPVIVKVLDLPLAPRKQCWLPDGRTLLVADSFGPALAVVDMQDQRVAAVEELQGHNLRDLTLTPDGTTILVPHQILHSDRTTTEGGVHWGGVMSNVIRSIRVEELLRSRSRALSSVGNLYYLGFPDRAAGDPSECVATRDGRQVLAYAGVSEIAISDRGANHFEPIAVGQRPTAMILDPAEQHVYVANTLSDSVSVVQLAPARVLAEIPLGPRPESSLLAEGERLFYDARLSSDGWYSCHSCHTDGHSNGLLNDNFSDGSYGAPKRVLSLLGVGDTGPWAWNGSAPDLQQQIRKSIEVTMQGPKPSQQQVKALAAYLRSLQPPPSLLPWRGGDQRAAQRGQALFQQLDCGTCHQPAQYTSAETYDVGIHDELGNTHFNPPSLRGVSQRRRFFHDNRAATLREVFARYQHQLAAPLTAEQLEDLLSFLRSL